MSTRILGLLTTTAAISAALTAGIAAAAAAAPPPAPDTPPPHAAAQQPPAAQPAANGQDAAAKSGKDAKADTDCADVNCEIKIHDGQVIRFDKKYNLAPVHIGVEGNRVTMSSHDRHGAMMTIISATRYGSTVTNNGVTFRPKLNQDGSITMKISRN